MPFCTSIIVRSFAAVSMVVLLVVQAAVAQPQAPPPSTTFTLALPWIPHSQFAGVYMAAEKGYFTRRGINLQLTHCGPGTTNFDLLQKGECQFTTAFLADAMVAREQGLPLYHLSQYVNRSTMMIAAWKSSGVKTVADLDGRRISVWPGNFLTATEAFFNLSNIRPVLRPQYDSINLFLRKGVDACTVTSYNEALAIYLHGVDPDELTYFRLSEAGLDFPEDSLYALKEFHEKNPEVCAKVRDAIMEGWRYAAEHREEAIEAVIKYRRETHLPDKPVLMQMMLDTISKAIFPEKDEWTPGKLSEKDFTKTAELLMKYGYLQQMPSYTDFVDRGE